MTARGKLGRWWPTAAAGVAVLVVWEAIWRLQVVDPLFFAGPTGMFAALWRLVIGGQILAHYGATLYAAALGLAIAVALGVSVGVLFGLSRRVRALLGPYVSALNATPRVALIAIFVTWLGLGLTTRLAVVVVSAFFPVFFNTAEGVRSLDPALDRVGRAFGCTTWERVTQIVLPSALPHVLAGIRLAVGRGLVVVVIAEIFIGSLGGIGYFISQAGQQFRSADIFAAALLLAVTGAIVTSLLERLEARLTPWHQRVSR